MCRLTLFSMISWLVILVFYTCQVNSISASFPKSSKVNNNPNVKKADEENIRNKKRIEKEQLFEAYNLLHSLAQDFHKPFDSPAVIVVGHQTSGKSALIEALMGFQFNQVGGGTKTRRPVALRMQYNPLCTSPMCFLTLESGKEEKRSLADIQSYIESENKRLERDPSRSFDPREINIRMEYKYCPNMIVIDTPGMLHPPKGRHLTPQQRALAQAAREAESLVLNKIKCEDYIILCVEDTTDWKHATTRNVVMQADPDLSRTVLVTTKLDTKLPQFSEPDDLEDFLAAPLIAKLFPRMLGGPFYTSVPAGRVGVSKDFLSNEMFVAALRNAERKDKDDITSNIGLSTASKDLLKKVGVNQLRAFLETRVEECYRRNVAKIVPLLQNELRVSETKLNDTEEELNSLSLDRLRKGANLYREKFAKELSDAIHGTVKARPDEWGETLDTEQLRGGSFMGQDQVRSTTWQSVLDREVGHNNQKLFGGAQYHRALREFSVAVRHMKTPQVSEDEIANAAGMGEVHDGVNFMRAACVIAIEKAQQCFEPMLESLRHRAAHIMRRLFPIVEHMCNRHANGMSSTDPYNKPLQDMIRRIYDKFVDQQMEICLGKCRDDLRGMTRFVTWDSDGRQGSSALYKGLPTPKRVAEIYTVAIDRPSTAAAASGGTTEQSRSQINNKRNQNNYNSRSDVKSQAKKDKSNSNGGGAGGGGRGGGFFGGGGNNNKNGKKKPNSSTGNKIEDKVLGEWTASGGGLLDDDDDEEMNLLDADSVAAASVMPHNDRAVTKPAATNGAAAGKTVGLWEEDAQLSDYYNLLQLMEEMLAGRNANRTTTVVTAIVQYIIKSWTEHFAKTVSMKFNCFFLMPFLDDFPIFLRNELDKLYDSNVDEMFDIAEARAALFKQRRDLQAECEANSKLQRRFDQISSQLRSTTTTTGSSSSSTAAGGSGNMASSSSSSSSSSLSQDEDDNHSIFDFSSGSDGSGGDSDGGGGSSGSGSGSSLSSSYSSPFELSAETLQGLGSAAFDDRNIDFSFDSQSNGSGSGSGGTSNSNSQGGGNSRGYGSGGGGGGR